MDSHESDAKPRSRLHMDRTLHELESALNEWDALNSMPAAPDAPAGKIRSSVDAEKEQFKKRTKQLLEELRRQLSEL